MPEEYPWVAVSEAYGESQGATSGEAREVGRSPRARKLGSIPRAREVGRRNCRESMLDTGESGRLLLLED